MKEKKIISPGRPRLQVDKSTVVEMYRLHQEGTSYRELERRFGISRRTIGRLLEKL